MDSRTTGVPTVRSYLLTGLVHCGRCDKPMGSQPRKLKGQPYRRYACKRDRGGCGGRGIAAPGVEELVSEAVLELREGRARVAGEGRSIYFYDFDNHMFELHSGTLNERLARYDA